MTRAVHVNRGPSPRSPAAADRSEIVEQAIHVLERDGPTALNLRSLAHELNISAAGLYRYFANKEELLDGVVSALFADIAVPEDVPWDEQLRQAFTAIHAAMSARTGAAAITAGRRPGAVLGPLNGRLTSIVDAAGFTETEGRRALRALASYTLGFALVAPHQNWEDPTSFGYGLDLMIDSIKARAAG